jgi:hypothetical protein
MICKLKMKNKYSAILPNRNIAGKLNEVATLHSVNFTKNLSPRYMPPSRQDLLLAYHPGQYFLPVSPEV